MDSNQAEIFEIYRRYCVANAMLYSRRRSTSPGLSFSLPSAANPDGGFGISPSPRMSRIQPSCYRQQSNPKSVARSMLMEGDVKQDILLLVFHVVKLFDTSHLSMNMLHFDIRSRNEHASLRDELAQFIKLVVSREQTRDLVVADLSKLMSHLNPTESCQFQCFYDFVFVMCREKDQKNITVSRAIAAWRIVLVGRFRLLNQWCDFVEKHQRHNISEDTWQQVLAFSRCVHEDLGGYDQKGAWPVLIDDFVEHMFRITPSNTCSSRSLSCNCGDPEAQACISDDAFRGRLERLKVSSGSKRKPQMYFGRREMDISNSSPVDSLWSESIGNFKRSRQNSSIDQPGNVIIATDGKMEKGKHGGGSFCTSNNSACAVEGSLSKGFAGLLSPGSCLQFDQKSRVSFT